MGHNFIKSHNIPYYIKDEFPITTAYSDLNYKKCSKCGIEVVSVADHSGTAEYMYLKGIEVFDSYYDLKAVNLTCEDIIIKNIIE